MCSSLPLQCHSSVHIKESRPCGFYKMLQNTIAWTPSSANSSRPLTTHLRLSQLSMLSCDQERGDALNIRTSSPSLVTVSKKYMKRGRNFDKSSWNPKNLICGLSLNLWSPTGPLHLHRSITFIRFLLKKIECFIPSQSHPRKCQLPWIWLDSGDGEKLGAVTSPMAAKLTFLPAKPPSYKLITDPWPVYTLEERRRPETTNEAGQRRLCPLPDGQVDPFVLAWKRHRHQADVRALSSSSSAATWKLIQWVCSICLGLSSLFLLVKFSSFPPA